jgi:peroxiredoxin
MTAPLAIGDEAPVFDLASTSGAVLMLRDELARTAVLLYFFGGSADAQAVADPQVTSDLVALARATPALRTRAVRPLALAPAPLATLAALRVDLDLPFPLLADDRHFHRLYGLTSPEDGGSAGSAPQRGLVLVDRRQRVSRAWLPLGDLATALEEIGAAAAALPSPLRHYPKSVINRWVEWWVS